MTVEPSRTSSTSSSPPKVYTPTLPLNPDQVTELLDEIVQRIVAVSNPEQIILFGSYARGDVGPDSDLDLLVIKDEVDSTRAETTRIYRSLAKLAVPVDVIVVRTAYVQRYGDLVGTVIRPALQEGKVLYVR